jgi:hypothetical protein
MVPVQYHSFCWISPAVASQTAETKLPGYDFVAAAYTAIMVGRAVSVLHGEMTGIKFSHCARCAEKRNTNGIGGGEQDIQKRAEGINASICSTVIIRHCLVGKTGCGEVRTYSISAHSYSMETGQEMEERAA